MFTEMTARRYRQKQRAERAARTRLRIVEAAVALHGEVGPNATTIRAIADRAGVQRLTVYRHFPDERTILAACSGLWLDRNPPPDPARWRSLAAPARTRGALAALYAYYRAGAYMWRHCYRDMAANPALQQIMARFAQWQDALRDELLAAWGRGGRRALRAPLGHALRFSTWDSLAGEKLTDGRMAELMTRWFSALAKGRP